MKKMVRWWLDRPWCTTAIVGLCCATALTVDLIGSQASLNVFWYVHLPAAFCALFLSIAAIVMRPSLRSTAPLAIYIVAYVVDASVPWEPTYLRVMWMLHRDEYTGVVDGLRAGRLKMGGVAEVVDAAGRPVMPYNTVLIKDSAYPVQNIYFSIAQAGDRYMHPIGYMYTPTDDAAVQRAWDAPDTVTRLEPHWYSITAAEWQRSR